MRKFCLTIAVLLLTTTNVLGADFLYHSDGPYRGKVVDLETGKPIDGAVVAGVNIGVRSTLLISSLRSDIRFL